MTQPLHVLAWISEPWTPVISGRSSLKSWSVRRNVTWMLCWNAGSTSEHAIYFQTWPSLLRFSLGTQPSSGVQRAELWNTLSNNLSLWNVKPTCEIYYKNRLQPREHGHNPILGRFAGSHSFSRFSAPYKFVCMYEPKELVADHLCYDTIRDAILTCARKPT